MLSITSFLVAGYIRLIRRTLRWEMIGEEHHQRLIDSGAPFICAFWHSRLLMMPTLQPAQKRAFSMLISENRDGEYIARTMDRFRISTRRGSAANPKKKEKNKGGAQALRALVKDLRDGRNVGITPDGPRGPRQRAQPGIGMLTQLSGAPVLPISYSVKRAIVLNSWDRFFLPLPLPFSKAVFVFSEPIIAAEKDSDSVERLRAQIETSLNSITEAADRQMGRHPMAPAPLPHPDHPSTVHAL